MLDCSLKRCVAVVNPAGANGHTQKAWLRAAPLVGETLLRREYELQECFSSAAGSAVGLAAAAAAGDAHVVMAVGGDGTVHEVANGLMIHSMQQQQQLPPLRAPALAIVPLGTGSDFARTFSWRPGDVQGACMRVTQGNRQPLDIIKVTLLQPKCNHATNAATSSNDSHQLQQQCQQQQSDAQVQQQLEQQQQQQRLHQQGATAAADGTRVRYCINVGSYGAGAKAASLAGGLKWLRGLAYPVAAALALLTYKRHRLQVCVDDSTTWQTFEDVTVLAVGNCRYWGGGLQMLPEASPNDGLLDVVLLQGMGLWDFITKSHLLRSGKYVGVKGVTLFPRCSSIQVIPSIHSSSSSSSGACSLASNPSQQAGSNATEQTASRCKTDTDAHAALWECDGEVQAGSWESVKFEVVPGALQICS